MSPEEKARLKIDEKLTQAGWVIQDMRQLNLGAAIGVAVREYPTDTGPADYVLFVNRNAVGVIEAKKIVPLKILPLLKLKPSVMPMPLLSGARTAPRCDFFLRPPVTSFASLMVRTQHLVRARFSIFSSLMPYCHGWPNLKPYAAVWRSKCLTCPNLIFEIARSVL